MIKNSWNTVTPSLIQEMFISKISKQKIEVEYKNLADFIKQFQDKKTELYKTKKFGTVKSTIHSKGRKVFDTEAFEKKHPKLYKEFLVNQNFDSLHLKRMD